MTNHTFTLTGDQLNEVIFSTKKRASEMRREIEIMQESNPGLSELSAMKEQYQLVMSAVRVLENC